MGTVLVALDLGSSKSLRDADGGLAWTIRPPRDKPTADTTSKQVQAWLLRRSRDLCKKKYTQLKLESKRLKQHVVDVGQSRADWRDKAHVAQREVQQLQARIADLQARRDSPQGEAKKMGPSFPFSLINPASPRPPPPSANPPA